MAKGIISEKREEMQHTDNLYNKTGMNETGRESDRGGTLIWMDMPEHYYLQT